MDAPSVIRPYRAADRARAIGILSGSDPWRTLGYTANDWRTLFEAIDNGQGREAFVVECDGVVQGAAVVRRHFLVGDYLEIFVIAQEASRQGRGRMLLSHLEQLVFSRSKNFFLCVSDFNISARAFYRRQG